MPRFLNLFTRIAQVLHKRKTFFARKTDVVLGDGRRRAFILRQCAFDACFAQQLYHRVNRTVGKIGGIVGRRAAKPVIRMERSQLINAIVPAFL